MIIGDLHNDIYVSAVVVAETSIKASLGKLAIDGDLEAAIREGGFLHLPLSLEHSLAGGALPWHHRDPFDRLLIAQAAVERMPLLTADARIRDYPIECV